MEMSERDNKTHKNSRYQISLPIILVVGIAAGMLIGATFGENPPVQNDLSRSVQKFREVLSQINEKYVDEVDTDQLTEDAITHILRELDPHSSYITAADRIEANEDLQGNFEGIGIEFNIFKDTIVVVTPLSGGPSEEAGLRAGDRIISIDGKNVAGIGFTNDDVRDHLKGPKDTEVMVGVKRPGKRDTISYDIKRDRIPQHSVDAHYMLDAEKGYIKISRFSATTYEEFREALAELEDRGMSKLIIDLQNNPGGYMDHAIRIADELLPDDDKIVYTKGKQRKFNEQANAERTGLFEEGPLIILVNEGSASASEILTGALQDNDRALIVGRRTFGKGLVQMPIDLSDGSELRLTISRYYTPSGRSIQKPYDDRDDYSRDLLTRYQNGEFFSADSIQFNDSLKFKTSSGRDVYGGGGIMPDYFVPLDTSHNSEYLNKLFGNNAIQEFTFRYVSDNKDKLENMGYDQFFNDFTVTDNMLSRLMEVGESNGVKKKPEEVRNYKKQFQIHVKAQIARQIWDNNGFYPIYNQDNDILQQAIKLIDEAGKLDRSTL